MSFEATSDRYEAETQRVTAARVPAASALLLFTLGLAHTILWLEQPERGTALAWLYLSYLAIVLLHFLASRQLDWSIPATVAASSALMLSCAVYYGVMPAETQLLVLGLGLVMVTSAILYPLGVRAQLLISAAGGFGYPLALALGAEAGAHLNSDLLVLTIAIAIGLLAAFVLETQRRTDHQRAVELTRERRVSTTLLEVGQQLNGSLTDLALLAAQLTDSTRAALGADWGFLYHASQRGEAFQAAACSRAPAIAADELLTFDYSDLFGQELDRSRSKVIEIGPANANPQIRGLLLRWRISRILLQPIRGRGELIAVLGCCFEEPHESLTDAERRVLSGIVNQAAVALDGARSLQGTASPQATAGLLSRRER